MGILSNGRGHQKAEEPAPGSGAPIDLVLGDEATAQDELHRIRELLFGVEMGKIRDDLARVDDQVSQQSGNIRELVSRRLDAFERNVQNRLGKMEKRLEACSQLEAVVESQRASVDERLEKLGGRLDESHSNLTSELHGQGKLFSAAIQRRSGMIS